MVFLVLTYLFVALTTQETSIIDIVGCMEKCDERHAACLRCRNFRMTPKNLASFCHILRNNCYEECDDKFPDPDSKQER